MVRWSRTLGRATLAIWIPLLLMAMAERSGGAAPVARRAPAVAELWVKPESGRDLFYGPGGQRLAPDAHAVYQVIEIKVGGFSQGYTLKDREDREWSAKFPPEASTEVAASRIHWGIGYHQPPVYFLREWQAEGATAPNPQLPARFREKGPALHGGLSQEGEWSFYDNPFVGTRELAGLLVLQVMLGNSDLKDSNNTVYTLEKPVDGVTRWYTARDVGHTLGRAGLLAPRGDIETFEQTPFIRRVEGGRVELEFGGRHTKLLRHITTADVRWTCQQLDGLTDQQWQDAFRAAGYERGLASRFIARLKTKIAEGLALP